MKTAIICVCVALVAGLSCRLAFSTEPPPSTITKSGLTTMPSSGDAASDLVASFYKALLQEEPPTREQEKALFCEPSWVRTRLAVEKRNDPEDGIEPMRRSPEYFERRRQDEAKAAAAGPVVLTYLRKHKDWFLPIETKDRRVVTITSLIHYMRGIDELKAAPEEGQGIVLAVVPVAKNEQRTARTRLIIFPIEGGKINVDWIHLDGHDSPMIMDEVEKEP